jgi:hypothetical protein
MGHLLQTLEKGVLFYHRTFITTECSVVKTETQSLPVVSGSDGKWSHFFYSLVLAIQCHGRATYLMHVMPSEKCHPLHPFQAAVSESELILQLCLQQSTTILLQARNL